MVTIPITMIEFGQQKDYTGDRKLGKIHEMIQVMPNSSLWEHVILGQCFRK